MEKRDALRPVSTEAKGLLDPAAAREKLRLARVHPSADLAPFVEHHWIVAWDLRGQAPHAQRTLPYPCVNVVFDRKRTAVFGVIRGAFEYLLEGRGRVLGVRFRPGAFRGFLKMPVARITDRTVSLSSVLGVSDAEAEREVLEAPGDEGMIHAAEAILRRALPAADPTVELVSGIVDRIGADPGITRVDRLAEIAGFGVRDLQRLFAGYVGVSPKWVIRRSRLHEVAHRLAQGEAVPLTRFAQELGYFDQAHLTRDFKAVVGRSPSEYQRAAGGAAT
ncbi:MAG: AraC family transcriptional regulator [Polyangiaceae bacterium]|nr:AraC family transcriptional regulator [Polyangiaceae bacterium]